MVASVPSAAAASQYPIVFLSCFAGGKLKTLALVRLVSCDDFLRFRKRVCQTIVFMVKNRLHWDGWRVSAAWAEEGGVPTTKEERCHPGDVHVDSFLGGTAEDDKSSDSRLGSDQRQRIRRSICTFVLLPK